MKRELLLLGLFLLGACSPAGDLPEPDDAGPKRARTFDPPDAPPCAVNSQTDPLNCGGCGHVCYPIGVGTCSSGQCHCPIPLTACPDNGNAFCDDLNASNESCGACGRHCINGTCQNGMCTCPNGLDLCNANDGVDRICTSTATDPAHCGSCDTPCPDGLGCEARQCTACPSGWELCGGVCTDIDGDDGNCGGCGHHCPAGRTCLGGACVRARL
jgi:hypothetical protein